MPHKRFFVAYTRGKCTVQCVGVNTFGKIPSEIAAYLQLPNPQLYTGHSFRRSSASILANTGEGIEKTLFLTCGRCLFRTYCLSELRFASFGQLQSRAEKHSTLEKPNIVQLNLRHPQGTT
ncbi:hypothetical protein NQ315_017472 [Exocentrus adspersus]|uniref:Tyr recombinase domain-containing protein n=1 Tax=Exocentrus adspersus TaxID=1586481 RepID=A0AAV8VJQ5_9CUCU|nr:hypothetical protein NQ315_017472 [Exocentrus adspersus]